jgi:hypothetical protein
VRQSFLLYTGNEGNAIPGVDLPALTPRYDVIERVVSFELPLGVTLEPNTLYTTELAVPVNEDDFGFRAFDARPLDEQTTVRTSFLTSNQRKTPVPPDFSDGTCGTVVSSLSGRCTNTLSGCHTTDPENGFDSEMGLDLSDPNGLILTAIGHVAHQTETGPNTGVPTQNPDRFGQAMPRIDPGRPDNSYLIYKLLLLPENYSRFPGNPDLCYTSHLAPVGEDCVSVLASAEENQRLQDWFVRGVGMPRPVEVDGKPAFLTRAELRGLEGWIRNGAACP